MTNEELKLLFKGTLVTICYFGYVLIFLKILKNKLHSYIDKPELILVVGIVTLIGFFGGCALLSVLDAVFTKILGG